MNMEFINYEQALALKELGFDEPCFRYYNYNGTHFFDYKPKTDDKNLTIAPLYQQAFRWFRQEYGLHVIIDETIRPQIKDSNSKLLFEYTKDGKYAGFEYEEAELACIDALIEIVKTNNEK